MSAADPVLWHVTVLMQGRPEPLPQLHRALVEMCAMDPMNLAVRYREDRAELQFWDEGPEVAAVADAAARLWGSLRDAAGLPAWTAVGLDVRQQQVWREQEPAAAVAPGSVAPFG